MAGPFVPAAPVTLHERLASARESLVAAGFRAADATIDAEVLARHVLGWDQARLLAQKREPAPSALNGPYDAAIARRARREPVAFITGSREFWGLEFAVTTATLVPRPETERIVEEALRILPDDRAVTVLDIGTGSGCLGVAIASERPHATVIATDISVEALRVARANAAAHGVAGRMRFVCADLVAGLACQADLIVANPPYVPDQTAVILPPDVVRYEPAVALFGGTDGLAVIRRLFGAAASHLAPGGIFIAEFGYGQEDDVRDIALQHGWCIQDVIYDLQAIARTIVLRR